MNSRTRRQQSTSTRDSPAYLRYLKPGTLGRIRDSRISSRPHPLDCKAAAQISSPPRAPTPSPAQIGPAEGPPSPCFSGRIYRPRCPQRKKIAAAKDFSSSSNLTGQGPDPSLIVDMFSSSDGANNHSNILVAH